MSRKPPDFDLWAEVTRSVKPLRKRKPARPEALRLLDTPKPALRLSAPHVHIPRPQAKSPPAHTGFDRRTMQKMTRGNVEIERRLDLHGTGVEMARVHLLQFLRGAHGEGLRTVLVITGKGASPYTRNTLHGAELFHSPERGGLLRRLVPEWLHEAEFRALVSGFQPAHPKHGGGGAYYVKIRRAR
ncbi:MAG TPA: Smr/MutS family protein [Aestuariivirga sp.]|nr:Smr/MutS family protein [Aestuariivirga sp.]